jgi:hypothetical protein
MQNAPVQPQNFLKRFAISTFNKYNESQLRVVRSIPGSGLVSPWTRLTTTSTTRFFIRKIELRGLVDQKLVGQKKKAPNVRAFWRPQILSISKFMSLNIKFAFEKWMNWSAGQLLALIQISVPKCLILCIRTKI